MLSPQKYDIIHGISGISDIYSNIKERDMKKLFVGFMGVLLAMAADAAGPSIKAATVKDVNSRVSVIQTGTRGVTPETTKLTTEEGSAVSSETVDATAIGGLAAKTGNDPTSTINANDANILVLKRDKLSVAGNPNGNGHCDSDDTCGYVTTGGHNNNNTDKIWMRLTRCTGSGNNVTCEQ